jgi:hypothetical protein
MKNWKRTIRTLLGVALFLGGTAGAQAALNVPVPASAYISQGGLDWAWANPLPGGVDLSFQGGQGWRIPTPAELAFAPFATAFLKPTGNVPFNGADPVTGASFQSTNAAYTAAASAGACATPYFANSAFLHCDWQDGLGQPFGPWAGMPGAANFADQLVVRGVFVAPVAQPIPALGLESMVLLSIGLALAGFVAARRRRQSR